MDEIDGQRIYGGRGGGENSWRNYAMTLWPFMLFALLVMAAIILPLL